MGGIISERWATSSRNGERHHFGRAGGITPERWAASSGFRSQVQDFFFDEKFELRRHDYSVNIAGGFPAAQLMLEYTEANGMRLPSKRRAYTRGPDRRPILDMLMVSIDISDVAFS